MLKKIINISGEAPSYIKKQVHNNYPNHAQGYVHVNKDSQHISEAGKFLKKWNWKLKKLSVKDKNFYMEVSISGFNFSAEISLPVSSGIDYTVSRDNSQGKAKIRFFSSFSLMDEPKYPEFRNLSKLFKRIESAGFDKNVSLNRNVYYDYLFADLKIPLGKEFSLLNYWLLRFMDIYTDRVSALPPKHVDNGLQISSIHFD